MSEDIDLFAVRRGSVTAPAGCGKTHLIAETLKRHSGDKPVLIITHTVAGVVALKQRLDKMGVSPKSYRVTTIDGWAIRLVSMFPARSGIDPEVLKIRNPKTAYPAIRKAARVLLKDGHVDDVLAASFSHQFADEYQDCSVDQHAIVYYGSRRLPTCVLGDPMQAVFDFGGDLPDWDTSVCKYFPPHGELSTPWRWKNVGTEALGLWLLDARKRLANGQSVDLSSAPEHVQWIELDGTDDHARRARAATTRAPTDGRVLIIGDSWSPSGQRLIASRTPGATTVESVDLRDFIQFAERFRLTDPDARDQLITFADDVLTGIGASNLRGRFTTLLANRERTPPTDAEQAGLDFESQRTFASAVNFLVELNKQTGVRAHRPLVFSACIRAMNEADAGNPTSLHDAAVRAREQNRQMGRALPRRGVGSTLTLKGLEAEVAVIMNPAEMTAAHLYVSMTRGSMSLVVCSPKQVLKPAVGR